MIRYEVVLTKRAKKALHSIRNRVTLDQIGKKIKSLTTHPQRGKRLRGDLSGYFSIRAARDRYRIVYRIERSVVTVYVIAIGLRKGNDHDDVYQALKRLRS